MMKCNLLELIRQHPQFSSQRQLAQAVGMDPKQMSKLSRNLLKGLHFRTMRALCSELDCSLDDLFSLN
jgi:DNA-binding Xre family transcriptional regulator